MTYRTFPSWIVFIGAFGMALSVVAATRVNMVPVRPKASSRVTVALVNTLPLTHAQGDYDALVVRKLGHGNTEDLILLTKASANGASLDAAMRVLLFARAAGGSDTAKYRGKRNGVQQLGVVTTPAPPAWAARFDAPLQRAADSLLKAPERQIAGIGHVRALDIYLPHKTHGLSR